MSCCGARLINDDFLFRRDGIQCFSKHYNFKPVVQQALVEAVSKPQCDWHLQDNQTTDSCFNQLFVSGHYLIPDPENVDQDVKGFHFEQVFVIYFPDLNTLVSIDGNGEKSWEGVSELLPNERCFLRATCDASTLIYKVRLACAQRRSICSSTSCRSTEAWSASATLAIRCGCHRLMPPRRLAVTVALWQLIDAMIDGVYPLLDLYGDEVESLEFVMIGAPEPTETHVQKSYKLKRRVHSLRRYAWNSRQLLQELRQNNFGVVPPRTQVMLTSVERNADNMVEVAEAYMQQCAHAEHSSLLP